MSSGLPVTGDKNTARFCCKRHQRQYLEIYAGSTVRLRAHLRRRIYRASNTVELLISSLEIQLCEQQRARLRFCSKTIVWRMPVKKITRDFIALTWVEHRRNCLALAIAVYWAYDLDNVGLYRASHWFLERSTRSSGLITEVSFCFWINAGAIPIRLKGHRIQRGATGNSNREAEECKSAEAGRCSASTWLGWKDATARF
jgi:hypothetical protein